MAQLTSIVNFFDKLHVNLKPLCDLFDDINKFHCKNDLETLFYFFTTFITKDVTLTLPNTNHPFVLTADCFLIGKGCVLFQKNYNGKLDIISYDSRIFTTNDKKNSTTYQDLTGIVYSPTKYEHKIFGSDHFINALNNHKPNLSCFTRQGNLSPLFYAAQIQITKFRTLFIFYAKLKNFSVADMLGRFFTEKQLQLNQLEQTNTFSISFCNADSR